MFSRLLEQIQPLRHGLCSCQKHPIKPLPTERNQTFHPWLQVLDIHRSGSLPRTIPPHPLIQIYSSEHCQHSSRISPSVQQPSKGRSNRATSHISLRNNDYKRPNLRNTSSSEINHLKYSAYEDPAPDETFVNDDAPNDDTIDMAYSFAIHQIKKNPASAVQPCLVCKVV